MRPDKCGCHFLAAFAGFPAFHCIGRKNRQILLEVGSDDLITILLGNGFLSRQNEELPTAPRPR